MTILIVDKNSLQIVSSYQADAPNQATYGGPWGDSNQFMHVALPDGMIQSIVTVASDGTVSQDPTTLAAYISSLQVAAIQRAISGAISFGEGLLVQISAQNVMLGITADGKTAAVMAILDGTINCLRTGSLVDAITVIKAIPTASYDSKYITAARLLAAVNQIETYLGITLSTSLS